jgi:hypothetical protein
LIPAVCRTDCRAKGRFGLRSVKNPKAAVMRTTYVSQIEESLTNAPDEASERPTVVCRDCRSPSSIDSLIDVDALHVQCPVCLYVFFLDTGKKHSLSD